MQQVFSQVSVGENSQNTVWRAEAGADAYVYMAGDVDENLDSLNKEEDITDQFMEEKDIKVLGTIKVFSSSSTHSLFSTHFPHT